MATAARVSNISSKTTKDALTDFLESKGLALAADQSIALTSTQDGRMVATVTFLDNATLNRALGLPLAHTKLDGRSINIDDQFDGFTILSEGTEVDIVALHGLNGHAFSTWEHRYDQGGSFMWLRDSLPEQIPGARIMTYGYRANVLSDVQTGRLRTFSETFLEELRHVREESTARDRPLILIAYSMGGLIVKQALLIANTRADKRFDSILNSIAGIKFLGTPHRGGYGINGATFMANFLHAVNVGVRVDLIRSLDPKSMILFDLTDDFRQLIEAKNIQISTLFETKKTVWGHWPAKHRFLCVEERSAILGVARETKTSVDADHTHLCKFKNSTDISLVTTALVIKEWVKAARPAIDRPNEPGYPILQYGQYSYWALSHADKRYAMAILAYNKKGRIVGRWTKNGSRYIRRIEYDEERREVAFVGEGNTSVIFSLTELEVLG